MIHIHNGDSSADTARLSTLPGEHFAFREALIEGPTPAGLDQTEWLRVRASHLADYGENPEKVERDLEEQQRKLSTVAEHKETVLWFEHDLFCQSHLIYLLDWFVKNNVEKTNLSLICIGQFPGKKNFRGLGELNAAELASLFPDRRPVTPQQLDLATSAWNAYSSSDPTEIQTLLQTDTSALPFLAAALMAHLKRFPSSENGLGGVEQTSLELISVGPTGFTSLFHSFIEKEPTYGFGDAQLWLALRRMSKAQHPLIEIIAGGAEGDQQTPALHKSEFAITDTGRSVLNGDADFVALNGIDLWLGGVHLADDGNMWRWDNESQRVGQV